MRAVEGGRVTLRGTGFPVDSTRPSLLGDAVRRALAFASSDAARHPDSRRSRGRRRPSALGGCHGETRLRLDRGGLGDRAAPGRQPGVRSRRQSLRHLQRLARPGSAGLDLPRHARGHARAVRLRHRQRDVDGARTGRPVSTSRAASKARCTALRDDGTPRTGRVRSRRRLRDRVRCRRLDVCRRSIGHDLPRARRRGPRRSPRCRRASPPFISR